MTTPSLGSFLLFVCAATACAQNAAPAPAVRKLLFLGNSITLHGPKAGIDWSGNWGMAASAAGKDYVHLVTAALAKTGTVPEVMVRNIAEFERQYATYDVEAKLKEAFAFRADTVIVAIGENVPELASEEARAQFKRSVLTLLHSLKADNRPTILVRGSFFLNREEHGRILKAACEETGGTFVDIGSLGKDESNYARSERPYKHKGVAAHPGDKGMQAIADALLQALRTPAGRRLP